jgi:hypothetical protein
MRLSRTQCEPRSHRAMLIGLAPSGLIELQDAERAQDGCANTELACKIV